MDTTDNRHNATYLLEVAIDVIRTCLELGCKVTSIVMDNATNMNRMRQDLAQAETDVHVSVEDVITYGFSSHILHLLSKDIRLRDGNEHVKQVIKYFRNTHFASARYKEAGGKSLVLPLDVRWNIYCECLESYIVN